MSTIKIVVVVVGIFFNFLFCMFSLLFYPTIL